MKLETIIYDKVKLIIPDNSEKNIFFAAISNTKYEVFFYSFIDNKPIQCYTLAEENILNENELDIVFEEIANIIKSSKLYQKDKLNVATINLNKTGIKMDIKYYDIDARLYQIKKEWTEKSIQC